MYQELKNIAGQVLDLAKGAGAEAAAVKASHSRFTDVALRDGAPDKASASTRQGLSLRLFLKGRYAVHVTSDLRPQALKDFVSGAAALTMALEPDPQRGLPDPARYPTGPPPELDLFDPELSRATAEQWASLASHMEAEAARAAEKAGPPSVSVAGGAYGETAWGYLADSAGFSGELLETGCFAGCSVVFMDPRQDGKRRTGWWWEGGRELAPLLEEARLGSMAAEAVRRGLSELGAKPGPSGQFPLVVENQAARQLVGHLLSALSGQTVHNQRSYLAGRLGENVASPLLTLRDEPLIKGGMGSRWFDAEGAASRPRALIEKGALQDYYLNTYYARKLGLKPGAGSVSNVVLEPSGGQDFARMIAGLERGLAVTGFLGGNFNSTTGDFSLGVKGLWMEDGEPAHAVEGMNLAGNALDLWRSLLAVGNDPYPFASVRAPSLHFAETRLSGV